jgi:ATP-dependent RNA helicase SUPV3L1/SUV3
MTVPFSPPDPLVISGRDVTAVLGPTNTGKTHMAIERMLTHRTGVIGLPLRLLAREVYTRVCEKVGAERVSLVTGEEKITPRFARYSVCTVEAMPRETDADFVAIDEVQVAGDLERGHVFTDRILHLRGKKETLLLGAATMRFILEKLLRGINVITRPRMSQLLYAGQKKIMRLPPRTAIVAFSTEEVYAIAELIRRQRGGAAVVLGALSPRTRNAQVELFQSGDVDYLIATDAIGMGLNLDVDHVAFAQDRKFDGWQYRNLNPAELAQIAGRAGRHVKDGTFGVTGQVEPFEDELVRRIEAHEFEPVRVLQWRTSQFDFSSLQGLINSIDTVAPIDGLTRALPAVDVEALHFLAKDEDIQRLAVGEERVAMLWDACSLPDYRKIAPAQHAELVSAVYKDLATRGYVDENYMAEQVKLADRTEGEIDTLSQRIAQIRTWTFVANHPGWLANPSHWQQKTREIEDRLSDALHERLTKRFVDRRTSVLMKRLRENEMLEAEISVNGDVLVAGHLVGALQGFRFSADATAEGEDAKAIRAAALKALALEYDARAYRFSAAPNGDIALAQDGTVRWLGAPVATLASTEDILKPRAVILADEQLTGPSLEMVQTRIDRFVAYQVEQHLKPLADLAVGDGLLGPAKGLAYRLHEALGIIKRKDVAEEAKALDQDARSALRKMGVRFGAYHIFLPALLKPAPATLSTLLWALKNDAKDKPGYGDVVTALAAGRTSVVAEASFEREFYRLSGFRVLGKRAVRIDILERLADLIRPALAWNPGSGARPAGAYDGARFVVTPAMMSILGATSEDMTEILRGLGYRSDTLSAEFVEKHLADLDAAVPVSEGAAAEGEAAPAVEVVIKRSFASAVAEAQAAEHQAEASPAESAKAESAPAAAADVTAPASEPEAAAPLNEATEAAPAEAEPKVVLVWKQVRHDEKRPEPRPRNANRRPAAKTADAAPVEGGEAKPQRDKPQQDRRPHRDFKGDNANERGPGKPRFDKRRDGKPAGEGRPERKRDDAKPSNFQSKPREERPAKFDPDSPFAKLAALRDQMKK